VLSKHFKPTNQGAPVKAFLFTLIFGTTSFAQTNSLENAAQLYNNLEEYNDMDLTNTVISFITGKELESSVLQSTDCGPANYNDLQYYSPLDATEDAIYLYSQTAARHMQNMLEMSLISAAQFNNFVLVLNKSSNELYDILSNKDLDMCTDYSAPAFSDGMTVQYFMVNGKIAFAIAVGRPD
jgi:hypothetical protein